MCCDARCTPSIAILLTLTMRPHHAVIPSRVQDGRRTHARRRRAYATRRRAAGRGMPRPPHSTGDASLTASPETLSLARREGPAGGARGPRRFRSHVELDVSRVPTPAPPPPTATQKRMKNPNTIYDNERKPTCARGLPCAVRVALSRTDRERTRGSPARAPARGALAAAWGWGLG